MRLAALCFLAPPFLLAACLALPAAATEIDLGRAIFTGAAATEGEVRLGATLVTGGPVRFPCRRCHGRDGEGGTEGAAPAITWDHLVQPTALRPAYDRADFARALREGVAPGGRALAGTMPRYSLPAPALHALATYLDALPEAQTKGVTLDALRLGVLIPPDNAALARAYAEALEAALAREIPGGRVFGRAPRIERVETAAADVLALVGVVPSRVWPLATALDADTPVLFPLFPLTGSEDSSLVRGLMPSEEDIETALLARIASDGAERVGVAGATADDLARLGRLAPASLTVEIAEAPFPEGQPLLLPTRDRGEAARLLAASGSAGRVYGTAGVLLPAVEAGTRPAGGIALAVEQPRLLEIALGRDIPPVRAQAELAARLLAAVIERAGRRITRAGLLAAFDGLALPEAGLDYEANPLSGTREVRIVDVGP